MMAGFEEELGVQLFARAKKGVTLTDNGRMLMPYIPVSYTHLDVYKRQE